MKKNYYLTVLRATNSFIPDVPEYPIEVTQLVKASSKDNAREAVKKAAFKEYSEITILEIRVHDTLIGK